MTDRSKARARLRDYARETVAIPVDESDLEPEGHKVLAVGMRGELAGHVFQACQNVLEECALLEEESRAQPVMAGFHDAASLARGGAAARIEAALLKGLGG
jgi:hypothetical protein